MLAVGRVAVKSKAEEGGMLEASLRKRGRNGVITRSFSLGHLALHGRLVNRPKVPVPMAVWPT